jgi:hypothetical protein
MKKLRKCRAKADGCEITYQVFNSLQPPVCGNIECKVKWGLAKVEKQKAKDRARLAREKREGRERLKTLADHLNDAQRECNRFIRLRDAGKPCISCGNTNPVKYDAGHYKTVGSRRELRFHPFNIHRQCSNHCNKNLSGNVGEYRKGLIAKIGLDNVEWLDNHHDYYQFTVEDAKEIMAHFRAECKRLKEDL